MKRTLKKGIAFFLFLAMSLQLFVVSKPVTIHAEEAEETQSEFVVYEDYLAEYNGTDKDVVIPDDLGIKSVYLSYKDSIESLTVPEGVTNVAVYGLSDLKKINLPSTLNSLSIEYCSKIKTLDLSGLSLTESSYVDICECESLTKITAQNAKGSLYVSECNSLTELDIKGGNFQLINISYCPKLKKVDPESSIHVTYAYLAGIEEAVVPENTSSLSLYQIAYDKVVIDGNTTGYYIEDGGLYLDSYSETEEDGKIKHLIGIDTTRNTVNVADGTKVIDYLELSGCCYSLETVKLPGSVEEISYGAFWGGESIKNLNIPKNVITLGAYAFGGISADLVLPESIRYISDFAFSDYSGKISIKNTTDALETYKDGIYFNYINEETNEKTYTSLIYYPSDKTTVEWKDNIDYIGEGVFKYSKISKLAIPEGIRYLALNFSEADNLESISIPASVWYIEPGTISSAPYLKTVSVSKKNNDYKSYKNCLYDKEMTTLIDVPRAVENIVIPEGVISLGFYVITPHYLKNSDTYINPTVTLPRSASESGSDTFIDFGKAYIYADTDLARVYKDFNDSMIEYAAGEYDPYIYNYEFRDSNKALLNMIYCVDEMSIKKGKKDTAIVSAPLGMSFVSTLTKNNNTECKISFSSSDKSIATVNSKTGLIKAKKQGTCTINVKCTLTNGKKTNTKKFKIRLKVK